MKLVAWLAQHGVSQAAFAETIGSSQPQVARFAAGTRIPNRETMLRIVAATDGAVRPDDFYSEALGGSAPSEPSEAAAE